VQTARIFVWPGDEPVQGQGHVENGCGHGVSFPGLWSQLSFKSATRDVADIRNIAEHVDEYAVGRGHLDRAANVEPGEVIERLASCVDAAMPAHYFDLAFPKGLDFDFMSNPAAEPVEHSARPP
jgi:hypothetical protein